MRYFHLHTLAAGLAGLVWASALAAQAPACGPFPVGATETVCTCTGTEAGAVWGSGPYTADSAICVAARHAGVIGAQGGEVRALARPGQDRYAGSIANGVQTSNWGRYDASFALEPVRAAVEACGRFPVGQSSYRCSCTGAEGGSVWGSGPYTADSAICVAARHAGVIGAQGGVVDPVGLPGQASYPGSSANGVQTATWGSYGNSFDFLKTAAASPAPAPTVAACGRFPGGAGPVLCSCTGSESGAVWGSNPYTSDSDLCAAARHAGVIGAGGGVISVLGIGGLAAYRASEANGVVSASWGSYGSSVVFDRN